MHSILKYAWYPFLACMSRQQVQDLDNAVEAAVLHSDSRMMRHPGQSDIHSCPYHDRNHDLYLDPCPCPSTAARMFENVVEMEAGHRSILLAAAVEEAAVAESLLPPMMHRS